MKLLLLLLMLLPSSFVFASGMPPYTIYPYTTIHDGDFDQDLLCSEQAQTLGLTTNGGSGFGATSAVQTLLFDSLVYTVDGTEVRFLADLYLFGNSPSLQDLGVCTGFFWSGRTSYPTSGIVNCNGDQSVISPAFSTTLGTGRYGDCGMPDERWLYCQDCVDNCTAEYQHVCLFTTGFPNVSVSPEVLMFSTLTPHQGNALDPQTDCDTAATSLGITAANPDLAVTVFPFLNNYVLSDILLRAGLYKEVKGPNGVVIGTLSELLNGRLQNSLADAGVCEGTIWSGLNATQGFRSLSAHSCNDDDYYTGEELFFYPWMNVNVNATTGDCNAKDLAWMNKEDVEACTNTFTHLCMAINGMVGGTPSNQPTTASPTTKTPTTSAPTTTTNAPSDSDRSDSTFRDIVFLPILMPIFLVVNFASIVGMGITYVATGLFNGPFFFVFAITTCLLILFGTAIQ